MPISRTAVLASALAFTLSVPALADWVSIPNTQTGRATRAEVQADGRTLKLSCLRGTSTLYLTLSGGPFPGINTAPSMMMWIQQADGRTARHPIDGQYLSAEQSFIGQFATSPLILDQFARGAQLQLTTVTGAVVFRTTMRGTGAARADMRRICRI